MAMIETWFSQDLTEPVQVHQLDGNVFSQDNQGNLIGVNVFDGGAPATISGTVSANVIRADGETVAVTGVLTGNSCYIILPSAAYAVPGIISVVIKLTGGGSTATLCAVVANVYQSATDATVDPGTIIPSVQDLIEQIQEAVDSIPLDYSELSDFAENIFYAIQKNAVDILCYGKATVPLTAQGITATKVSKSVYHFEGRITGANFISFYESITEFPKFIEKGKKYIITINGASENNKIYFDVIGWPNGSTVSPTYFTSFLTQNGVYSFTIPETFSGGVYIRAGWLSADAGSDVSETIEYHIFSPIETEILKYNNILYAGGWANGAGVYDCNDVNDNVILFVEASGGVASVANFPYSSAGFFANLQVTNDIKWQIAFPWYPGTLDPKYRVCRFGTFTEWVSFGGGGSTVTIEQEVSRDTYNNEYNISVSPQITTDANGWLQPVDTDTESETGKTDMTSAIMAMLNSTGYCHLAPGIYYVSGNIDMPAGSMIEGCGDQTIIRLLQSTTSGYIVRMHTKSTLKNVRLSGGYNPGDISNANIGGRKGVNYIGNRDGQTPTVTPSTCTLCVIEGCFFENLDSGIYGYNAGGGLQNGLVVSDCYFTRCKAGINLDYWVEYCKFTNCVMFQCYFACINNGGNNVFTACTFHGVVGFLIDNSANNKQNIAHGSVIGCTFNHIDNMNNPSELGQGYGVKVLNAPHGFIFANCQLWYGRVHVENSPGVQFTGCEFGGLGGSSYPVIETSGSGILFVDNCLFATQPVFALSGAGKFSNCWTYSGAAVGQ